MKNLRRELILAGAAVLLVAPLAFAQPTDAEFKCEQSVDKAGAKFVGSKSKCISKCLKNFWKALVPSSDCFPPYGGDTGQCINDTVLGVKGAENKFSTAIKKACDAATKPGTECPQCYDSGDCSSSGFATDQVQNIEGQVDSFVPGVACELGADAGEQKCQLNTAKALAKQVSGVVKCYDKCQSNAHKGLISVSTCDPPATDPATAACISTADGKAIVSVNKLCGDVGAIPDCSSTDDYPDGATWVNLVDVAISGNQPATYCASATTSTSTSSTSSSSAMATTSSSSSTVPTTSSSSSIVPTTSSSSSTITPTTTTNTTTTGGGGGPSGFDFLSTAGSGSCGNTFRDLAGTIPLKNLGCGILSLGGGLSQVPDNATPSGATNRFSLSCVGAACNIGATTSGSTPAGVDCTDTGCKFGVPLPISNAGLSVCVTNTFSSPPTGTLNTGTGDATWDFELNSATVLTGNPTQPCPICAVSVGGAACSGSPGSPCTGVCDGSPNQGAACQSKNPNGLSSDCPAPAATAGVQKCFRGTNNGATCSTGADCPGGLCSQFIGNIAISLNPLTTGTSSLSNASGLFCPGQTATQHGAYKSDICQTGANSGKPCDRNASGQDPAHCGAGITCRAGTLTNYCSAGTNNGLGCAIGSDCGTGGVCSRAGTLVQLVREVGLPAGALSVGVPKAIKLGSAFCVAATTNPTVNSNANLPASGSTSVLGNVTLLP